MVSPLKLRKFTNVFDTFLDINKDGYIDKADFDILSSRLNDIRGYKLGQPEYEFVEKNVLNILNGLLEELDINKDGRVSKEEWTYLCEQFAKDPTKKPKWQKTYEDFIVEYYSLKSALIKKDVYVEILSHFGFTKENAEISFDKISGGKPVIDEAEFRQIWREYFTSDDPSSPGNAAFIVT